MKSAEDRSCSDLAEPLDWTNQGRVLGQGKMRPHVVVVGSIGLEDPSQMVLAQDHDVVQALPRRIEPISLSAWPFCRGERLAVG